MEVLSPRCGDYKEKIWSFPRNGGFYPHVVGIIYKVDHDVEPDRFVLSPRCGDYTDLFENTWEVISSIPTLWGSSEAQRQLNLLHGSIPTSWGSLETQINLRGEKDVLSPHRGDLSFAKIVSEVRPLVLSPRRGDLEELL